MFTCLQQLQRGMVYMGAATRLRRVIHDALSGKPIKVGLVGGRCGGTGVRGRAGRACVCRVQGGRATPPAAAVGMTGWGGTDA